MLIVCDNKHRQVNTICSKACFCVDKQNSEGVFCNVFACRDSVRSNTSISPSLLQNFTPPYEIHTSFTSYFAIVTPFQTFFVAASSSDSLYCRYFLIYQLEEELDFMGEDGIPGRCVDLLFFVFFRHDAVERTYFCSY